MRIVTASQTLTAASFPPEARVWPSGEKANDTTAPERPRQTESRRLPPASQSSILPLAVPQASVPPLGENASVIAPGSHPPGSPADAPLRRPKVRHPTPGTPSRALARRASMPRRGLTRRLIAVVFKVRMFSPDETSHSFAVPSVLAEARVRPSGENTTQLTCRLLPSKTARRRSVATSHSAML